MAVTVTWHPRLRSFDQRAISNGFPRRCYPGTGAPSWSPLCGSLAPYVVGLQCKRLKDAPGM